MKKNAKSKKRKALSELLLKEISKVQESPLLANVTIDDLERAIEKHRKFVVDNLKSHPQLAAICSEIGAEVLAEAAISAVFRCNYSTLDASGVITAGYGEQEYFPSVDSHYCYGNVLGKLVYSKKDDECRKISQKNTSEVLPFAKSDMIYTFMLGVSINGLFEIEQANMQALDAFAGRLTNDGLIKECQAIISYKNDEHDKFKESITNHFRTNHTITLKSVVGMLPIDELAELSEILIQIESIKERVTTDEESVSGPIDVAIITKNDGFIWIKRKHYFKADLNPRYFHRMHDLMEESDEKELG